MRPAPVNRPFPASRAAVGLLALTAVLGLAAFRSSAEASSTHDRPEMRLNGAPSHKENLDGRPIAWLSESLTITLDPSLNQAGPGVEAVQAAFGAWLSTEARLPSVRFEIATSAGPAQRDGVNRVLMAPIEMPGHQKDLSIAISYTDESTAEILEVDIVLNSAYRFGVLTGEGLNGKASVGPSGKCGPGTYDLQDIAAHEAGHFFGLGEDKQDDQSTMFFESGSCEILKRDLQSADAEALVTHYERAAEAREAQAGCSVSTGSSSSASGLGLALAALALIGRRRWMRR